MVLITAAVRRKLKKPLGALQKDYSGIGELSGSHRIVSVGDVCTLELLKRGIVPHLAVFDHLFMRHELDPAMRAALEKQFSNPKRYANPAGTLSDAILADAGRLISEGGAVLVDGEEDLTALAFILAAGENDVIIYGQPNEGIVVVRPDSRLKKKIGRWLADSAA